MQKTKTILFNSAFFLNCLLLFLLLFYEHIAVPSWLQVFGRMHPLILHFPVVLLLLYIAWEMWLRKKTSDAASNGIGDILLLTAAFSAALTALFGLLLSKEEGYAADALALHKYTGVSLAFLSLLWYALRDKVRQRRFATPVMSLLVFSLVLLTGDLGAGITHGENYLIAPVLPKQELQQVALEDAVVFTHMVQPVLQSKCINCHNNKKAKGELVMESAAQLLKGGKDGALWDTANLDASLLLKRIHLPVKDEKHMPPEGKPQLTQEETNILYYWLKSGASFTTKVTELPATDSLRMLALAFFKPATEEVYDFAAADENVIHDLSNNNRVIVPLSLTSAALSVDFYNSEQYDAQSLKDLLKLKDQLVSVNLAHMPATDEDLATLAQLTNLRKLNLNFTKITGKNIAVLSKLPNLKELSLSGTPVTAADLQSLDAMPKLKNLYAWNTAITDADAKKIKRFTVQTGFYSDTVIMKLTPPILQNETTVFSTSLPLQLKHYINGATIRYSLDGNDPDSTSSLVYDKNTVIDKTALLKAKAFKKGWISSEIMEAWLYKSTYTPDSIALFTPGDALYKGDGGKTLIDHVKGDLNFKNNLWLGFNGKEMEALMIFHNAVTVQSVTISGLVDIGGYIMPPQYIEIWGGNEQEHLKLLSRTTPKQPSKTEPGYLRGFDCTFAPTSLKYIKIKASAVTKLPAWHPGKGGKAWLFVDEIFAN